MNETIYKFTFRMPPAVLHPNARGSHFAKIRPRQQYRDYVHALALQQTGSSRPMLPFCRMDMVWYYPKNNSRDRDNILCWFKTGLDGLGDAGIFGNDNSVIPMPVRIVVEPKCIARVEVEIQQCDPEEWK